MKFVPLVTPLGAMNNLWFDRVDLVCFDREVQRDHHREQHRGQAGVGHGVDID